MNPRTKKAANSAPRRRRRDEDAELIKSKIKTDEKRLKKGAQK